MRGIYQIRNTTTDELYIGKAQNIAKRWEHHRATLKHGMHHNHRLQEAWDVYGPGVFEFSVIEEVGVPYGLGSREAYYISVLVPQYNLTRPIDRSKDLSEHMARNKDRNSVIVIRQTACSCCFSPIDIVERRYRDLGTILEIKRVNREGKESLSTVILGANGSIAANDDVEVIAVLRDSDH